MLNADANTLGDFLSAPVNITTEQVYAVKSINSGFMITQYTAASIVSLNKNLCSPASVDSIPSSQGQEDLFRTVQPFCRRKHRYSSLVHLLWRGKPASFMKNALTLPGNEFPAWVKVGIIYNRIRLFSFPTKVRLFPGIPKPFRRVCSIVRSLLLH